LHAWRSYRHHLALVAGDEAKMGKKAVGRLSHGWAIGSPALRARLNEELVAQSSIQERFELLGADRAAHVTARAELWEERLQSLAAGFGVAVSALPTKKSAEEKLRLAAAMKHITSVSNGWLAERLQMGATTSVSSFLHRFHESGRANTRAFKAVLSRFSI